MLMTEIGWQGLKFDDYMIRVGIRGNGIFEKYRSFGNVGLQVSVLRSFRFYHRWTQIHTDKEIVPVGVSLSLSVGIYDGL